MLVRKIVAFLLFAVALPAANALAASADMKLLTPHVSSPFRAGQSTSGSLTVSNAGPDAAENVTVTLQVPAGSTMQVVEGRYFDTCAANGSTVTCSVASVLTGHDRLLSVSITPGADITDGQTLLMTATVTSATQDPVPANNSASATATAIGPSDLSVIGSFIPYNAGEIATVTMTMTNHGPNTALNPGMNIQMNYYWIPNDQFIKTITQVSGPPGQATITSFGGASAGGSVPSLAPGESASFRLTMSTMSIRASIYLYTFVSMFNENTSAESVINFRVKPDALADLDPVSTAPATVFTGEDIPFAVQVRSRGPSDGEHVSVTWSVPPDTTFRSVIVYPSDTAFTCTSLAEGSSSGTIVCSEGYASIIAPNIENLSKVTFVVRASAPTTVTNRATVTSTTPLTNTADDFTEKVTTVTTPQDAVDASVTITPSAARVRPGAALFYIVKVTNAGPGMMTNAVVQFSTPAGYVQTTGCNGACTIASLPAGQSTTFTFTGTAPSTPANTIASAGLSAPGDTNLANNNASSSVVVQYPADISVTLTGNKTFIPGGSAINFTNSVHNAGPGPADDTRISFELPPDSSWIPGFGNGSCSGTSIVVCTLGSIASGATTAITLVILEPHPDGTYINRVTATTADDPNLSDNSASVSVTVSNNADVALTATVAPAAVQPGAQVVYSIAMRNIGPELSYHPVLTATLPLFTQFLKTTQPALCSSASNVVTCRYSDYFDGTFNVDITATAPTAPGTHIATFNVVSPNDSLTANNSATVPLTVLQGDAADLSVAVNAVSSIHYGTPVTYTVTARNDGTATAANVVVTPYTSHANVVSMTSPTMNCTGGAGPRCTMLAMVAGTSASIELTANVDPSSAIGSTVGLGASITGGIADSNPANNQVLSIAIITGTPTNLGITLSAPTIAAPASPFAVHVVVDNHGADAATGIEIRTPIPAGVTFTGSNGPNCFRDGNDVLCYDPALAAGQQLVFDMNFVAPASGVVAFTSRVKNSLEDVGPADDAASAMVVIESGRRRSSRR